MEQLAQLTWPAQLAGLARLTLPARLVQPDGVVPSVGFRAFGCNRSA